MQEARSSAHRLAWQDGGIVPEACEKGGAMDKCEYDKPHPRHTWWADTDEVPRPMSAFRQCPGIPDPVGPPPGASSWTTHSKQALGEFELWKREQALKVMGKTSQFKGEYHLHFLFLRGHWEWVVREVKSSLCGTPRCRKAIIAELDPNRIAERIKRGGPVCRITAGDPRLVD